MVIHVPSVDIVVLRLLDRSSPVQTQWGLRICELPPSDLVGHTEVLPMLVHRQDSDVKSDLVHENVVHFAKQALIMFVINK